MNATPIEQTADYQAFVEAQADATLDAAFSRLAATNKPVFVESPNPSLEALGILKTSDLLEADLPMPGWVVEGMIPAAELSYLVSDGGIGKSWLLLALSETITNGGHTFLGRYCTPGNVVYLDMELDRAWYANRVRMVDAGLLHAGIIAGRGDYEAHYIESPRFTLDGAAAFLDRLPTLPGEEPPTPGAFDYLHAVITATGARLLILDPIAELWGDVEENSASETSPVQRALRTIARATGAAVVVAHHTNKGRVEERGSTAIRNASAAMFTLTWYGEGDNRTRKLECNKLRHDKEPAPLFLDFVWQDGRLTIERFTAAEIAERQAEEKAAAENQDVQAVLNVLNSKPKNHFNKKALQGALTEEGLSKRRADAAIKKAEDDGLVTTEDGPRNAKLYAITD